MNSIQLLLAFFVLHLCATSIAFAENFYAPDANHPWNRLHESLYSRTTSNGTVYQQEGLEPVFVSRSLFLTDGASHAKAIEQLDQFIDAGAEGMIKDPIRRAILQRDLWAVFMTTADADLPRHRTRLELQKRLVRVMRRVALSAEEIAALPNNLADAAVSKQFASSHRADQRSRPYLPKDLLDPLGPWVLVRSRLRSDDLAAPLHVQATFGRSVFLLFVRLPEGRRATLQYLARLQQLAPHEEIPQIPIGTEVALLRRMMLIDGNGEMRLSPITESLQIRVYHHINEPDLYEFSLRRADLFEGKNGGLHPTRADTISYFHLGVIGFSPRHANDPLEQEFPPTNLSTTPVVMKSCRRCHAGTGIFGFQSMFADHFDRPPLSPAELQSQVTPVVEGTRRSYRWGLMQGFWAAE